MTKGRNLQSLIWWKKTIIENLVEVSKKKKDYKFYWIFVLVFPGRTKLDNEIATDVNLSKLNNDYN